ncbi:MAG: hypothetical protein MUO26_09190 [Methanotrichaceae archaeon]|nr:hypothetical protein [Methanotrichaceae archaeon]
MKLNIYLFTLQLLILSLLLTTPSLGQGGCWLSGWCPLNPNPMSGAAQPFGYWPVTDLTQGAYLIDVGSTGETGWTVPTTWKTYGPYTLRAGHKYSADVGSMASLVFKEDPAPLINFDLQSRTRAMVYGKNNAWGGQWYALKIPTVTRE